MAVPQNLVYMQLITIFEGVIGLLDLVYFILELVCASLPPWTIFVMGLLPCRDNLKLPSFRGWSQCCIILCRKLSFLDRVTPALYHIICEAALLHAKFVVENSLTGLLCLISDNIA